MSGEFELLVGPPVRKRLADDTTVGCLDARLLQLRNRSQAARGPVISNLHSQRSTDKIQAYSATLMRGKCAKL